MIDQTTSNSTASGTDAASPRQRAIEAYESARGSATDTLGQAPLLALAGGIAAGALIAALLPRTEAETRLVRPTARRVKDSARAAFDAARDTGSQRLDEMGLNRTKGEETIRDLIDRLTDAAKASASAAVDAARNKS
ncbi:MAG TPA: hypothetical protein VFI67_00935 [Sphingomicrobium sp.]|jgi:hypothetical protein|nr:hypothetical protein [Sphingomicrobium sp.]